MVSLCIDTATTTGLVAVARNDRLLAAVEWRSESGHGEELLGHVEDVLRTAQVAREDIDLVGVDIGPGRFTGVRVGLGTAKGLALGLGIPIVGVCSLRVIAASASVEEGLVCAPMLDAYRGEVFAAGYVLDDRSEQVLAEPSFGPPADVLRRLWEAIGARRVVFCGPGVRRHRSMIEEVFPLAQLVPEGQPTLAPGALASEVSGAFARTGESDLDSLEPLYLKPSDAKLPQRAGAS